MSWTVVNLYTEAPVQCTNQCSGGFGDEITDACIDDVPYFCAHTNRTLPKFTVDGIISAKVKFMRSTSKSPNLGILVGS